MTIHEAIRSQWEIVKDRPLREKLSYFWSYYFFIILFRN